MADLARQRGPGAAQEWEREWSALDVRYLGTSTMGLPEDPEHPARAQLWLRIAGDLDDDPLTHLAAFTYASDLTLLGAALVPHGVHFGTPGMQMASLDHTVWFHRPFRADRWWLYDQVSPTAVGGRGLATARVFTEDGTLVATVAQEGLIRLRATADARLIALQRCNSPHFGDRHADEWLRLSARVAVVTSDEEVARSASRRPLTRDRE